MADEPFRVTLVACVAGNPLKAWRGGTDPDDVWEDQTHLFADLDAAKAFIRGLPAETTTHVVLEAAIGDGDAAVWTPIFVQDADAAHLDAANIDVPMPHTVDAGGPPEDDEVPEAPPLMAAQGDPQ